MNKLTLAAAVAAIAVSTPVAAPAQRLGAAVIAVVNMERVYRDCTACKAAQAQLQQQITQMQQRGQQLSQPIQTEGQALQTAIKALGGKQPDAALQQRIGAFQARQNSATQEMQGRQQTIERNRQHVSQQLNARLNPIVNQVMQSRGATIVVDSQMALASSPAIDVTNDVIAQLNRALPSVSTTAPAAPAQTQQQPQGR